MAPAPGSIIANRFELLSELGRGGMGTVWLAHHRTLDARCAVKFMSVEAMRDPSFVARFELEARTVAKLSSPNVVRVIDYDVHEGVPFIAMEYLEGEDLSIRLEREKRLDGAKTYRVISQVARGLAKAHAAGMVHRDLKPGNILLARGDDDEGGGQADGEVAKLLDFGVVKFTGIDGVESCDGMASNTQAGTLLGTPAYMSPEQARGNTDVDHRSDLWSLAVIAYECVLGRSPFETDTLGNLFAKILFEPLPVPSAVDPTCPAAFDRWWAHAASRRPEDRFDSATEMADALGKALGVVPGAEAEIEARPTLVPAARPPAPVTPPQFTPLVFDVSALESPSIPAPRLRRSKVAVALAILLAAPLAVMATSVRTDARAPRAAGMAMAPVAAPEEVARPAAARTAVLTPVPADAPMPVASSLEAEIDPRTTDKVRAVALPLHPRITITPTVTFTPANAPRPSATASAPPDDIDFGI
jgi:serine/threonine protein kinase